jgi:hypothetical protein
MPRAKAISTDDVQPRETGATLPAFGPPEISRDDIEVIDGPELRNKAEEERFMNELVEIQIEADEDPNSALFVSAGHQGVMQYIKRGEPQTIKRKFLYSLIAGKATRYACSFGKDQSGNEFNRLSGRPNTTHRLHVLRDSPKGMEMTRKWMAEP